MAPARKALVTVVVVSAVATLLSTGVSANSTCSALGNEAVCESNSLCKWCVNDQICVEGGEPFACQTFCCTCTNCASPPAGCFQGDAQGCFDFCTGCTTVLDDGAVCNSSGCSTPTPTATPTPTPDCAAFNEQDDCEAESFCNWCAVDQICVETGEPFACQTFCCTCSGCANPPAGCVQGDVNDCFAFCAGCTTLLDANSVCLESSCVTPTPTPRVPNGGFCDEPSDCRSANCVDNVCAPVLPVPAASGRGIAVALLALAAIGGLALVRRGRASSVPDGIAGDR